MVIDGHCEDDKETELVPKTLPLHGWFWVTSLLLGGVFSSHLYIQVALKGTVCRALIVPLLPPEQMRTSCTIL